MGFPVAVVRGLAQLLSGQDWPAAVHLLLYTAVHSQLYTAVHSAVHFLLYGAVDLLLYIRTLSAGQRLELGPA